MLRKKKLQFKLWNIFSHTPCSEGAPKRATSIFSGNSRISSTHFSWGSILVNQTEFGAIHTNSFFSGVRLRSKSLGYNLGREGFPEQRSSTRNLFLSISWVPSPIVCATFLWNKKEKGFLRVFWNLNLNFQFILFK